MSRPRAYVRPMTGWWRRNPFFVRYMIREATAVLVVVYALVLLVGVICLALGETAYERWLRALDNPWSLGLHALLLAGLVYHTWSWFAIMPKTMPLLFVRGKRVAPAVITGTGLVVAALASVALVVAVRVATA
jgi:succinate dehydrogenase subunit C